MSSHKSTVSYKEEAVDLSTACMVGFPGRSAGKEFTTRSTTGGVGVPTSSGSGDKYKYTTFSEPFAFGVWLKLFISRDLITLLRRIAQR